MYSNSKKEDAIKKKERNNKKGESMHTLPNEESTCAAYFPSWFLAMTDSPPKLIVFALAVLLCAPLLMVFGALYPLFKH